MRRPTVFAFFTALLGLLGATAVLAAGPSTQEVQGEKVFAAGELETLSLDGEGILRPGPAFEAIELAAPSSWAAVSSGDATWIGTGNSGELLRVDAAGTILRVGTGDTLMVTALAALEQGGVAAAVAPGGRILRVAADGTTEPLATLPVEFVWGLLPGPRGSLIAATGEPGALYRIDAFGAAEKLADVGDDHARCLTRQGKRLLVGTAPKGLVVAIEGEEVSVVRDVEAAEVVGIVALDDGGLIVAANADQAGGNAQVLGGLLKQLVSEPETKPGQKPQERPSLQDGRIVWLEPSGAVTTLWEEKKVAVLALAPDGAGAVAGTYPSGRLIRVEPSEPPAILADLPEAEASVLLAGKGGLDAVVTSNPAVLHRRAPRDAPRGIWTSKPLDGGAVARWGHLFASGQGIAKIEIRSGETEKPDDSWSAWTPSASFDGASGRTDVTARFLQLRATLEGGDAALRSISVVVAAPNRAPVLEEITVKRPGKKDEAGIPDPTPKRQVAWKAKDPDEDRLLVRLEANREGSPHWIRLVDDEVLEKPQYEWDTSGLPDGRYRLRLTLSDAPDTAPQLAREVVRVTPAERIDNTPPRVTVRTQPAGDRLLVEADVEDQPGGRVGAVRVSIDGGPWVVLAARDGILDTASETLEASVKKPDAGAHDVVVQARDIDGNVGAGATVLQVR